MWQSLRTLLANTSILAQRTGCDVERRFSEVENDAPVPRVGVVGLLAGAAERRLLARLGFDHGWDVHLAKTCNGAQVAFEQLRASVILYDQDLPEASWRHSVHTLANFTRPACVILVSSVADNNLWEELIRHGGYDVLAKPLRPDEVVRAVQLAWSFWNGMMKLPAYAGKARSAHSA